VDSIVAYHYELKEAGAYIIQGSMKAGASVAAREEALRAIEGEIFRLRTKLISDRELERAKTRVMKRFVDSLSRVTDRARLLGTAEVYYGDYRKIFRDLENYQKVTAQEVQKVAERFLRLQRSNTVIMAKKSKSAGGTQ
jgi:zinc protease